jgi:hypothetical protein
MSVQPNLSPLTRVVLIDHIDGNAIRYRLGKSATAEQRITHWAKRRALVNLQASGHVAQAAFRSGYTIITEKGREFLCRLLASYAEELMVDYDDRYAEALFRAAMLQNVARPALLCAGVRWDVIQTESV